MSVYYVPVRLSLLTYISSFNLLWCWYFCLFTHEETEAQREFSQSPKTDVITRILWFGQTHYLRIRLKWPFLHKPPLFSPEQNASSVLPYNTFILVCSTFHQVFHRSSLGRCYVVWPCSHLSAQLDLGMLVEELSLFQKKKSQIIIILIMHKILVT